MAEEAELSTRDELIVLIQDRMMSADHPAGEWEGDFADAIIELMQNEGHIIPDGPHAEQLMHDCRQFAEELILTKLACRLLRMTAASGLITPETKGMERWLNDYIDGRHHGPLGKAMFWPSGLPGLAGQLREWGFVPTPGKPPYVAKAPAPNALVRQ